MSELAWWSWGGWLVVVVGGSLLRSRTYGLFRGVVFGLYTLIALPLLPREGALGQVALYCHAVVYLDALIMIRPRLRPIWYRTLVSWPSAYIVASMLLAFPWAIVVALGLPPYGWWLPFVMGAVGLLQSLATRVETRQIDLTHVDRTEGVARVAGAPKTTATSSGAGSPALRLVQITDPHLGPFMSIRRLAAICERAVKREPHLVLLTGDFLTMESHANPEWLAESLRPLRALPGRVFACLGNHDHEAMETVTRALKANGIQLLVDEATLVDTPAGPVQIIGFDFHFRGRERRMPEVAQAHPRVPGALRLGLIHDPGAFRHLPPGELDLALAGHTHGGQVGLVSLGLVWTVAGWIAKIPDHGLWGSGSSRLYVHRGTGHYGFPLRLGVPAEESLLLVHGPTTAQGTPS